jgi:hypothetical protein
MQVTMDDHLDGFASDGGGPYHDGLNGVEAQIWSGGSEDVTLRLYYRNTNRRFSASCAGSTATSSNVPLPCADGAYYSSNGWFLNIRRIGNMPQGSWLVTDAALYVDGDGAGETSPMKRFIWNGINSNKVLVTRGTQSNANTWSVTTVPNPSTTGVGDLAVLDQQKRSNAFTVLGSYHMPFSLTVTCIANCQFLTPPQ